MATAWPTVATVFLDGLNSPFGMALVGNDFYVADTDALLALSVPRGRDADRRAGRESRPTCRPARSTITGPRTSIASPDGTKLYVTVGSNSNVGENGMAVEEGPRGDLGSRPRKTGEQRIFASGLRNPNGMRWEPETGALWTAVNERDELGSDLVPDYMTSVKEGAFYGWPYSYYGEHVDRRVEPQRPDLVAKAIAPDYALGPHTASLGLTFATGARWRCRFVRRRLHRPARLLEPQAAERLQGDLRAVRRPARPAGQPVDVLTGFLDADGKAQGRPVGVAIDSEGALLVADDVGNTVWRVTAANQGRTASR